MLTCIANSFLKMPIDNIKRSECFLFESDKLKAAYYEPTTWAIRCVDLKFIALPKNLSGTFSGAVIIYGN